MKILEPNDKIEIQHHEQPEKRGIASGIIHNIQPSNIIREITLMNGGVRMDFTGRDVLRNDRQRTTKVDRFV